MSEDKAIHTLYEWIGHYSGGQMVFRYLKGADDESD